MQFNILNSKGDVYHYVKKYSYILHICLVFSCCVTHLVGLKKILTFLSSYSIFII